MSLRDLSADFLFYGVLDFVQRSVGFLMVPLYTTMLSQAEYGNLDILLIVCATAMVVVDLQFSAAFSRLYLEYQRTGEGKRFAGTIIVVRAIGGVTIAAAVMLAGALGYVEWGFVPSFRNNTVAWGLVGVLVPLSLVFDVQLIQSRMLRRKRPFAVGTLGGTLISVVASVVFVAVWHWGMPGVIAGLVVGKAVGAALLTWALRDETALLIDRRVLRPLLQYSLPLIPGWWIGFAGGYLGRFFVYGIEGADQNALLAVSMKIAGLIGLFSISFRSAWQPLAMAYIGDAGGERFYVRSLRLFMAGAFLTALLLAVFLHPLMSIMVPEQYGSVEVYFPLFAVAVLIGECESNLQLGNQIAKRTLWISISSVVYLLVNVVVLSALTASLGVVAAGLALALASLAKGAVTFASAQMHWRIPYDIRAMAIFAAGCAAFLALGYAFTVPGISHSVLRGGVVTLAIGVPWLMLNTEDRQALAQAVRLVRSRILAATG
ncbi:MAG: lipopolysaccharide biosynthesis protein [Vicinamibacterales bacterium]